MNDFEPVVVQALERFGVEADFSDGQAQLQQADAEVWLRLEPLHQGVRLYQTRSAPTGTGLVVRSRIYTFRQPPRPSVLKRIQARAADLAVTVEYLPATQGLYVRTDHAVPPSVDGLVASIDGMAEQAAVWLDDVLPSLFA